MAAPHSPVFIIGVARSGTTLLSLMLDSHSRIAIPYESHFFVAYYEKYYGKTFGDREQRTAVVREILAEPTVRQWDLTVLPEDIDLEKCVNLGATIDQVFQAYARKSGKEMWGEKSPPYTQYVYM